MLKKEVCLIEVCFIVSIIFFLSLFVAPFLPLASASVVINEILPNAVVEYHGEWIELYNNSTAINLTNWSISDGEASFTFNISMNQNEFLVLVYNESHFNEIWNVSANSTRIVEYGNIAKNLKLANSGDNIELYNNSNIVDNYTWTSDPGENISICRCPDGSNWTICNNPTPGISNSCQNQTNETNQTNQTNQTSQCDIKIWITTDKEVYNNEETVKFYNKLDNESCNFTIQYWIEDLFGNIVKAKYNTTNTNQKTWTPSIEEKDKAFIIKSILYVDCNDTDLSNNYAEKIFIVKNQQGQENKIESSLSILDAPVLAEFGETINVKINVYKGDTSKYAVYAYITRDKKVSEKTTLHFKDKFTNYTLTIPIQLKTNCDKKYENGNYRIVLEGLDKQAERGIEISGLGDLCEEESESESENNKATSKKLEYNITAPAEIEKGKEFFVKIKIDNNQNKKQTLILWSYVYHGNKCCSESREANKKEVSLEADSTTIIDLEDIIDNASNCEPSSYKLKIKILRAERKTPDEFTYDINITREKIESKTTTTTSADIATSQELASESLLNQSSFGVTGKVGKTIYQSKSELAKKKGLFIFIILILIIAIPSAITLVKRKIKNRYI